MRWQERHNEGGKCDFRISLGSQTLLKFTRQGQRLEGTMNLHDGTLWRNISLRRD
jgi:hypothetical protein